LAMPKVVLVKLTGKLQPWVSAKDVILEVLRIMTVKGGVGKIIEYGGDGVKCLTVPQRATITNMGAELGATTSIFPSDENTRAFLKSQGREKAWRELKADPDAEYDEVIEIDLSKLEPLIAQPHSPDNVVKVKEIAGTKVHQVAIGSCTNSSYVDMMTVAGALKGKQIHPDVSLVISPGSRQVLEMIARNGALADMIAAGARILESTCGPCIGMGQAPPSNGISVRSFNRNFLGRSGTKSASVYLASPEVCVATALAGVITDPRDLGKPIVVTMPEKFHIDDRMILPPSEKPDEVEIIRGPNIKPLPINKPLPDTLEGELLLKVEDNITTDHIMPAGAKILPLRSNIPEISKHVFEVVDETFPQRALEKGGGFIVGGENYGQGSSREHAALAPMYLGIKWVLTKSFARIHKANLINFGILPLTFQDPADYNKLEMGDRLRIQNVIASLRANKPLVIENLTRKVNITAVYDLSERAKEIIIAGGLLNYTKQQHAAA
ncbi:MAG: aconitate hydratase, partial [candidate division KSB1 bacterium]|nr:aconitate hydratase [candidate division KSB1 bacterium]